MSRTDYTQRLKIPIEGDSSTRFYSKNGSPVAVGYERVVIGGRGPYVEFSDKQIAKSDIVIRYEHRWRLLDPKVYYIEWHSGDSLVKIYQQRKPVDYADYKVGMWYASPFDLKTDDLMELVSPIDEIEPNVV